MRRLMLLPAVAMAGLGLMLVAGCFALGGGTPMTRYYLLAAGKAERVAPDVAGPRVVIGVGPVMLPDYLDRPQLVTRIGDNQLALAEFDRWAEPLADSIGRVVAEGLSARLPAQRVIRKPARTGEAADLSVRIEIGRFEADSGGDAVLEVFWAVDVAGKESQHAASARRIYVEKVGGRGYPGVVAALNRTLDLFCDELAGAIYEEMQQSLREQEMPGAENTMH